MAKLTILSAALLLSILALAQASTYTTTITTTVVEEENPRGRPDCRQQVQRQPLRHCSMYVSQRSPYEAIVNPGGQQQEQHLRECCQELRNVEEQCRCEAIRQMVRKQQQEGYQGEEMQEIAQMAQYLPRKCHIGPQQCQIRAVWF